MEKLRKKIETTPFHTLSFNLSFLSSKTNSEMHKTTTRNKNYKIIQNAKKKLYLSELNRNKKRYNSVVL